MLYAAVPGGGTGYVYERTANMKHVMREEFMYHRSLKI
jgi:hypothetical protein